MVVHVDLAWVPNSATVHRRNPTAILSCNYGTVRTGTVVAFIVYKGCILTIVLVQDEEIINHKNRKNPAQNGDRKKQHLGRSSAAPSLMMSIPSISWVIGIECYHWKES